MRISSEGILDECQIAKARPHRAGAKFWGSGRITAHPAATLSRTLTPAPIQRTVRRSGRTGGLEAAGSQPRYPPKLRCFFLSSPPPPKQPRPLRLKSFLF